MIYKKRYYYSCKTLSGKLLAAGLWLILMGLLFAFGSCSSTNNLTTRFYAENREALVSIRGRYDKIYEEKPFHIEFKDRSFSHISFEILSDTMRMIYNFDLRDTNLADTLDKYHYNTPAVIGLIDDMRSIRVMWISKLDYYENREKKSLVFISIRHRQLESFMKGEKYYALAFFNERQIFDEKGRLTDRSEKRRTREINGQIFRRITDRVCYAITGNFR